MPISSVTEALLGRAPAASRAATLSDTPLAVAGLSKDYGPQRPVLQDIAFSIAPGQRVALIGPNGAGKSTLLLACTRIVEPSGGSVQLLGTEITGLSRQRLRALRARVGFIFQRHNLVPRLSVLSNVVHGALGRQGGARLWWQGFAPRVLREQAMECLSRVDLADLAGRRADQLSGGQSQRVAIARALMQRPSLLLADEPAASLDPHAGAEVMKLFHDLAGQHGITLVFTSHNLQHARDHADRLLALRAGRLLFDRPASAVSPEELQAVYG